MALFMMGGDGSNRTAGNGGMSVVAIVLGSLVLTRTDRLACDAQIPAPPNPT
jgi:hypothetical protein